VRGATPTPATRVTVTVHANASTISPASSILSNNWYRPGSTFAVCSSVIVMLMTLGSGETVVHSATGLNVTPRASPGQTEHTRSSDPV
jgi:hypothetical protein